MEQRTGSRSTCYPGGLFPSKERDSFRLSSAQLSQPGYRPDIDGLRAIAVLSVVAYHAFPDWVHGGFTGVDIFFVISGYLISTIMFENLHSDTFSFTAFYARRIKRIFPALILVLTASSLFGRFGLLADEYRLLGKHIAGASGFVSNYILWNEAGYFDSSAETKPLLHLWSLGIEEQFYIVWPLLVWTAARQKMNLPAITLLIAAGSFYLNMKGVWTDSVATFYSPQTRFWELLSGSLLAWIVSYRKRAVTTPVLKPDTCLLAGMVNPVKPATDRKRLPDILSLIGFSLLIFGFLHITKDFRFPGKWAVLPVSGAVILISAGPKAWVNRTILSNRIAVWFGLISFPLYLWHWPLLSFAGILENDVPGEHIRIAAVVLSVVLASVTYRYVERPIRFGQQNYKKVLVLVALMTAIGFTGYSTAKSHSTSERLQAITDSLNEAEARCQQVFPDWSIVTDNPCRLQKTAGNSIAVIGDSHAGHLYAGLSQRLSAGDGVAVFAASCAAPYMNVSTATKDINDRKMREGAYRLINSAYDYIISDPAIKTVVLAHNPECSIGDAIDTSNPLNQDYGDVLQQGMRRTFSSLIQANKKVVILFDDPKLPFDPKRCIRRPVRLTEKPFNCSFPRKLYESNFSFREYRYLVESVLKDYPQVSTLDLADPLCDKETCYASRNDQLLYLDVGHLNYDGSIYVADYIVDNLRKMK